jgi:hypothetical protein
MPRPIPGARFIACLLGGASLFGGAAALADAGRIGLTQFVAVPATLPGGEPIEAVSIASTLEPEAPMVAEAADAAAAETSSAQVEVSDAGVAPAEEQLVAAIPAPRLRPSANGESSG